ncbi:uncharacterized protein A4U43_C03F4220 [Asparagus officinalis]|uniref:Mal d 1-associated protein n=1 Tax=Asparagus officinalis TaxID=4686 RepID=A0A5P1FBN5_ASPOF|nr:uncharacterized protein LOC109832888 [Asparagus officinalis]ONK74239.1 uncharacterized protein A4U43_C03F4220 [Asparagus officinalis]
MGWKWEDEGDDEQWNSISISSRKGKGGFGDLVNPNPRDSMEEHCSTRRIVRSSCRTEEVEPGRFVRKCDKTEEILRDCLGRPVEVVESKTERTEEDVTDEVTSGRHSFESSGVVPFNFPGLRSDIDSIERGLFGGLNQFLEAAEEMANGIFGSFNIPSRRNGETPPFGRSFPAEKQYERDASKQKDDPYSELAGEVTDV